MKLPMGQCDIPQKQQQPVFELDLYRHNIAVFGSAMSGKTTFIKTLLVQLHKNMGLRPEENIYIVDFGGNIGAYRKLRNVCACYDNSNEEDIKRLFRTIDARLAENAQLLDSRNYYDVVEKALAQAPPHLTLIIENVNTFLLDERYSSYLDRVTRLCRDGLSKGLTVVITGNDTSGINRLLKFFGQKITFELPQEAYYDIFNAKVVKPMRAPGRGLVNLDANIYEFQCFLPFSAEEDELPVQALVEEANRLPNKHKMVSFGSVLTEENFERYCTVNQAEQCQPGDIVVGLDYYEHKPVKVNVRDSRSIAIYGKRQFGKTNLLHLLLRNICKEWPDARFIYMDDGREQLKDFCSDGKTPVSQNEQYFKNVSELRIYLAKNGYLTEQQEHQYHGAAYHMGGYQKPTATVVAETVKNPFTVFVMQAKNLYRTSRDSKHLMTQLFPQMISEAEDKGYLFIFSDVPSITNADDRNAFNNNISAAFLLDNIGDFIAEKGSGKTVFGEMDAKELKIEFARCSLGDGFFYDIERDDLQKLKFIKVE